jgi:acyl carrier protein
MTVGVEITPADVRRLLSDRRIFPELPEDLTQDTEFVLDSMGLIWLLHQVETEYGLKVDPSDYDFDEFRSVRGIVEYLHRMAASER